MPSIRRRQRIRREDFEELDKFQIRHLIIGHPLLFWRAFKDIDSFSLAWESHRDELLPDFIAKNPGHRPFAWWVCDHKKERPVIQDFEEESRVRRIDESFYPWRFGFLHTSDWGRGSGCLQQPEVDYLREHGLLTQSELKALKQKVIE